MPGFRRSSISAPPGPAVETACIHDNPCTLEQTLIGGNDHGNVMTGNCFHYQWLCTGVQKYALVEVARIALPTERGANWPTNDIRQCRPELDNRLSSLGKIAFQYEKRDSPSQDAPCSALHGTLPDFFPIADGSHNGLVECCGDKAGSLGELGTQCLERHLKLVQHFVPRPDHRIEPAQYCQ